jgi:hypothetical protein
VTSFSVSRYCVYICMNKHVTFFILIFFIYFGHCSTWCIRFQMHRILVYFCSFFPCTF